MSLRQLVILSGKGGTGKTSLTAAWATLAAPVVVADTDVDAPDLHLLLRPKIETRREFRSGVVAAVDPELCTACGRCREVCRFEAIAPGFVVDELACEGCGVCEIVCPAAAVTLRENEAGEWFLSRSRVGPMAHARLNPGEGNSGKLVSVVRKAAGVMAIQNNLSLILVDGPPGIGCAAISALTGASAAVIVTEPTPTGIQGFERAADLAAHFKVPAALVINKADLHAGRAAELSAAAEGRGVVYAGALPYDPSYNAAQRQALTVVEYGGPAAEAVSLVWDKIKSRLGL